jgi:hypothetical protein
MCQPQQEDPFFPGWNPPIYLYPAVENVYNLSQYGVNASMHVPCRNLILPELGTTCLHSTFSFGQPIDVSRTGNCVQRPTDRV